MERVYVDFTKNIAILNLEKKRKIAIKKVLLTLDSPRIYENLTIIFTHMHKNLPY